MKLKQTLVVVQYASFRSFPVGGISMFIESVLPHLAEALDLKLVGMSRGEPLGEWTRIEIGGREYDFLPVVSERKSGVLPDRIRLAWAILKYRKALASSGANGYYVHMTEGAISLMAVTRKPVVVHVHGLYNLFRFSRFPLGRLPFFPWFYEHFYPALFSRCARVLGTGSLAEFGEFRRTMRIEFGSRIPTCSREHVFYPRVRDSIRAEFGLTPEDRVVLFAGRMTAVKNIPLLLQAAQFVAQEVPGLKVVLAGDGPERAQAERIARAMGNVHFAGMLRPEELAKWMNAADVLALTSLIEGFPTTVVEALSCGLPCVTTPVSAAHELIQAGKNGAVAADFTVEAFSRALTQVLLHPPARSSCVESVEQYRPKAVSAGIIKEIEAALAQRACSTEREHAFASE